MKPREILETGQSRDSRALQLVAHDDRLFLEHDGLQLDASHLGRSLAEAGRLASAPFLPVRQPKILFLGLGFAHGLHAAREALPKEKAAFHVCSESPDLPAWLAKHHHGDPFSDERVTDLERSPFDALPQESGPYQAIVADLDFLTGLAPEGWDPTRVRWLRQASDTIKTGGLLAFLRDRRDRALEKNLRLLSCDPISELVPLSENSKKHRVLYLARKGHRQ